MSKNKLYLFCKQKNIFKQVVEYLKIIYDMDPTTCEIEYLRIAIEKILYNKKNNSGV